VHCRPDRLGGLDRSWRHLGTPSTIVLPISVVTERASSSLRASRPLAQRDEEAGAGDDADRTPLGQRGARCAHGGVEVRKGRQGTRASTSPVARLMTSSSLMP
jgi:hypothetical protein